MSKCQHGKRKTYCIECGGGGLCEHAIKRHYCKDCGGGYLCEHGKRKYRCKECQGSQICQHNKNKYDCVDCKGNNICVHNKLKRNCKDCGGINICIHNKNKRKCKECNGNEICIHNINKYYCKICDGSAYCEHNKEKRYCIICDGKGLCIHNKRKQLCKECEGGSICEHNKQRHMCFYCGGSQICIHNKRKSRCKICDGRELCKSPFCEIQLNNINKLKYDGYCLRCFIHLFPDKPNTRNYKTKEKCVLDYIHQQFPNFTWIADKKIQDGCSLRRPDLLLELGTHILIVEVDENKHNDYNCSCENKRLMEISQDLQHRPIIFIRFNPDGYIDQNGNIIKSCWKLNNLGIMSIMKTKQKEWDERLDTLKQQIQYWIDNPTEKTIEIVELFY